MQGHIVARIEEDPDPEKHDMLEGAMYADQGLGRLGNLGGLIQNVDLILSQSTLGVYDEVGPFREGNPDTEDFGCFNRHAESVQLPAPEWFFNLGQSR